MSTKFVYNKNLMVYCIIYSSISIHNYYEKEVLHDNLWHKITKLMNTNVVNFVCNFIKQTKNRGYTQKLWSKT